MLYPLGRTHGTHWIGGWVGPRAGLDTQARGKIHCLCRDWTPVIQSVVRHYTDWATPAPHKRLQNTVIKIKTKGKNIKTRKSLDPQQNIEPRLQGHKGNLTRLTHNGFMPSRSTVTGTGKRNSLRVFWNNIPDIIQKDGFSVQGHTASETWVSVTCHQQGRTKAKRPDMCTKDMFGFN
jgi:hypothetical protein